MKLKIIVANTKKFAYPKDIINIRKNNLIHWNIYNY